MPREQGGDEAIARLRRRVADETHELRMPLTLVLSHADRLLNSGGLDDGQRADVREVRTGALTVLKRVNELLDVARLEEGEQSPEPADRDLAHTVRETAGAFAVLAARRGLRWELHAPASWPARIDEEKIATVVTNLLANAVKFTPRGGSVRCSLTPGAHGSARIEVADSGPGVAPAERAAIFQRFRRGDSAADAPGGSGLGLAIAHQICTVQGGRLWVEDAPGGGALFIAELPTPAPAGTSHRRSLRQEASAALRRELAADMLAAELAVEEGGASAPPSGAEEDRPGRVLLIAANRERAVLTELLAPHYALRATGDGELGVHAALVWRPDVVVVHTGVPAVRDGSVLRRLRAEAVLPGVCVLGVVPAEEREGRVALLRAGARDTLVTPLAPEEVLPRVDNLVLLARLRRPAERAHRRETLAPSARTAADSQAHALGGGHSLLA